MKFKRITLDESLFDSFSVSDFASSSSVDSTEFDDDFAPPEYMPDHHNEEPLSGPATGNDTGVADLLIGAVNDEWEAIKYYNSLIATLRSLESSNPDYAGMISVIEEITDEENRHVGQLQEILKMISPNAHSIAKGEQEAKSQFNFVDGKLQIQEMPVNGSSCINDGNKIDNICSIDDVDDLM